MLETPLFGRFQGEGKRLFFGPPDAYLNLIRGTIAAGLVMPFLPIVLADRLPFGAAWWTLTGLAVALAGLYAWFSLVRITFDLRERTYRRWVSAGPVPTLRVGKIAEIESLAVQAVASPATGGWKFILVISWRQGLQAPMVVRQDVRAQPDPGPLVQEGARYAQALGVPIYDLTRRS